MGSFLGYTVFIMTQTSEASRSTLAEICKPLIGQFNSFCEKNGLVGLIAVDHICIKCSSKSRYESWRWKFENESPFIYQTIISERRISLIRLNEPLSTLVGDIRYLELSDQKPDNSQIDRIDHLEIIPKNITYTELIEKLKWGNCPMKLVTRPHHTTHDIILPSGLTIKVSQELLLEKIKREEFN